MNAQLKVCLRFVLALLSPGALAQQPRIFFTDLESGPNRGGENGWGVYVTLFGHGFGAKRATSVVTVGGAEAARYSVWTNNKVTVHIGPNARTGDIILRTAAGDSNPIPFTVRDGAIYFVAVNGDDDDPGTFERPWRTVVRAKEAMQPGDTTYIRGGEYHRTEEINSAALNVERGGRPGQPLALAAYPWELVTIGSPDVENGLRVPDVEDAAGADHWVVSQIAFRGGVSAINLGGPSPSNWKIVGNDLSCPTGDGQTGCFAASNGRAIRFLGNEVHHTGRAGASKQYHAVYFTTDSNDIEAAWNRILDNRTCRAIQFHSSPLCFPECGPRDTTGYNQYNLRVHDNLIRGDACDGINFATVDPSKGPVEAYNNVIIRSGAGPHPPDGSANYACIFVAGGTNTGSDGSGNVEVYNNTCYDFGSVEPSSPDAGAFVRGDGSAQLIMNLRNNIAYAMNGQAYVRGSSQLMRGTNNLWYGNGTGPSFLQGNLGGDPLFVSASEFDLRLRAGSPAIDAGAAVGLTTDFDGALRPQGRAIDAGAFEFGSTAPSPQERPIVSPGGIVDGFSFLTGAVAPGEIVTILGRGLGPAQGVTTSYEAATGRLPVSVAGVTVTWNGRASPLYFVRADQINLQVPYELSSTGTTSVEVTVAGLSSEIVNVAIEPQRPQLFPTAFHADFAPVSTEHPAARGEAVILFATGQGRTAPASVTGAPPANEYPAPEAPVAVTIGGRTARVLFSGQAPGTVGVMQLNVIVPADASAGPAAVVLTVGAGQSQPGVSVAVR